MTATADSRFVQSAVEPLIPPFLSVSTARRISNATVMKAQEKTQARPNFAGVRIWRSLSIARGSAMTDKAFRFQPLARSLDGECLLARSETTLRAQP